MDATSLPSLLEEYPVVASVKDEEGLDAVLRSECKIVFLLHGSVLDLPSIVQRLKDDGRIVLVNVDLIEGFAGKEVVVRYVKEKTSADGILSSKAFMVRAARELGLFAVHRFFLIDSLSYRQPGGAGTDSRTRTAWRSCPAVCRGSSPGSWPTSTYR